MKHAVAAVLLTVFVSLEMQAQTQIYWKRDTIYAGPGGGAIATVTPPSSDTTAPAAPTSLSSTSTLATSVTLQWTESTGTCNTDFVAFKVYRQKGSGANLPVGTVACTGSSPRTFTDEPLQPSTSYTYTVVAFDNAQNHSSASNSVNPTTSVSSGDATAPSAPPNLRGIGTTRQSTYKVRLDWDTATDAGGSGVAGYKVYRGGTLISGSSPITNRYYEDSTNTANTAFAYTVKAIDGASNASADSNTATVTTLRELILSEDYNHANFYYDYDDFANFNNTLQQKVRTSPGTFADQIVSSSQNTFAATVKVARDGPDGVLQSGFTFWATPGPGGGSNCLDFYSYATPWASSTGFYRVYETNGGYLRLDYWSECNEGTATISILANSSAAMPAGSGPLTLDVNHSTRRIKVYWNGVVKIDYTETNTSRPNSGAIALSGAGVPEAGVPVAVFDDLLLEK